MSEGRPSTPKPATGPSCQYSRTEGTDTIGRVTRGQQVPAHWAWAVGKDRLEVSERLGPNTVTLTKAVAFPPHLFLSELPVPVTRTLLLTPSLLDARWEGQDCLSFLPRLYWGPEPRQLGDRPSALGDWGGAPGRAVQPRPRSPGQTPCWGGLLGEPWAVGLTWLQVPIHPWLGSGQATVTHWRPASQEGCCPAPGEWSAEAGVGPGFGAKVKVVLLAPPASERKEARLESLAVSTPRGPLWGPCWFLPLTLLSPLFSPHAATPTPAQSRPPGDANPQLPLQQPRASVSTSQVPQVQHCTTAG